MALLFYEVHWLLRSSSSSRDGLCSCDLLLARIMRPEALSPYSSFGYNVTNLEKFNTSKCITEFPKFKRDQIGTPSFIDCVKPYKKGRLHNILKSPTLYPISSNSGKNLTVFENCPKKSHFTTSRCWCGLQLLQRGLRRAAKISINCLNKDCFGACKLKIQMRHFFWFPNIVKKKL